MARGTPLTIAAMCSIGRDLNTSIGAGDRAGGQVSTSSIATGAPRQAAGPAVTLLTGSRPPPTPKPKPGTVLA